MRSIISDRFGRLFSLRARGQNAVLINLPVGLASVIMTRLFIFDPPYIRARCGSQKKRSAQYVADAVVCSNAKLEIPKQRRS